MKDLNGSHHHIDCETRLRSVCNDRISCHQQVDGWVSAVTVCERARLECAGMQLQ